MPTPPFLNLLFYDKCNQSINDRQQSVKRTEINTNQLVNQVIIQCCSLRHPMP